MKQECIPVVCIPPTAVAVLGVSPYPPEETPPGANTSLEQVPPRAGTPSPSPRTGTPLARSPFNFSLGCGPGPDPPQLPPWVWAWTRCPSTSPLVVGLETCKACRDTNPPTPRPAPRHAGIPPPL